MVRNKRKENGYVRLEDRKTKCVLMTAPFWCLTLSLSITTGTLQWKLFLYTCICNLILSVIAQVYDDRFAHQPVNWKLRHQALFPLYPNIHEQDPKVLELHGLWLEGIVTFIPPLLQTHYKPSHCTMEGTVWRSQLNHISHKKQKCHPKITLPDSPSSVVHICKQLCNESQHQTNCHTLNQGPSEPPGVLVPTQLAWYSSLGSERINEFKQRYTKSDKST